MRISDWSSDVCSSDLRQASSSKPIEVVSYIDPTKSSKPTFRLRSTRNFNTSIRFGEAHGLWRPHSDYLVRSKRPQFRPPFGLSRPWLRRRQRLIGTESCRERVCQYV